MKCDKIQAQPSAPANLQNECFNNEHNNVCSNIMQYIDDNIFIIQKLSILSEVFGYNYCYLSYIFKKSQGISVANYFRSKRLETAKKMLESGEKISKVSEALNYSSQFSFSKAYKKYWGVSPKKHIKQGQP